jgi:hypothetical protein
MHLSSNILTSIPLIFAAVKHVTPPEQANAPQPSKYEYISVLTDIYKVKLFLCFFLTEHHAMEAYLGSGVIAPHIR